jgi:hypothetical protein
VYNVDGPIEKACFPGDATVTRLDPSTGANLGPARMDELRIGDAVACVKPAAPRGPGLFRDDEQEYVPGSCRVFNYHDVDAVRRLWVLVWGRVIWGSGFGRTPACSATTTWTRRGRGVV